MGREPDDEVRLALELATMCKELHVLPQAGGLLDQDFYYVRLLQAGFHAMNKREEHQQRVQSKSH